MPRAEPVVDAPARAHNGRFRLGEGGRNALALTIVALVFAIPLRGLFRSPGPPMEEGFMLVFPEQVLKGAIPNRDFLHLYGPGSLWALAGVFKVFGVSLVSERGFGLLQQLAIVFGIYALARRWGRILAVGAAVTSALIIIPFGFTALAWVGGVGLATCGLAAGVEARAADDERRARRWALTAGLLLGLAVLFRLDLVLASALATIALVRGMPRSRVNRLFIGFAVGVAPYLIQIATAGPGHAFQGMVIDPVFRLRGGRSLPIPPSWGHFDGFLQRAGALAQISWPFPALARPHQLFLWFFLLLGAIAFVLWQGWRSTRAEPDSITARTLLVAGLFGLGILPQALQRVDSGHFSWVSCFVFAFVPIAGFESVRRRAPGVPTRKIAMGCGAVMLAILLLVIPAFTIRTYADYSLQTFGIHRASYKIQHDGRVFYYGKPDRAAAANQVIAAAAAITKPGQRLFVGPVNLRKTPYSDAYLYYMLPDLVPATYYIEMDPGVANAPGSRLPQDLESADVAILSAIWDNWSEPNDSRKDGPDTTEQVLQRDFCHVGTYLNLYELYRKCH
ncbi:MAG TPA: glycosyltransferase family 39 protein [Acidimicrobiia bacterium]|nr:glycosyltransferase family 39 protein [Acidimicrobiia bacterium]